MRLKRVFHAALLAAAITTGAAAVAAPAGAATTSSIWHVQTTHDPDSAGTNDSTFQGVSASGPTEAWGVGTFLNNGLDQPLVEHLTGTTWTDVTVPQPAGQQALLSGVDDLSSSNAWAVGTSFSGGVGATPAGLTLIEHWNGTAWSIVPGPNPATGVTGDTDVLNAISGTDPDNLWAAGSESNEATNTISMLFEHWNGTTWTAVTSPTPLGSFQFASGITAISADNVWAVGTDETDGQNTLSAHWNGTAWSIVPTPNFVSAGDQNNLTGVSADGAGNVWASGFADNVNGENLRVPYVLHWNGTSWTMTDVPTLGTEGSMLRGIQVVSPTDVWAVGQTQEDNGAISTLTEHFNGTAWAVSPSPDPGTIKIGTLGGTTSGATISDNLLDSVASAGGTDLFAVGVKNLIGHGQRTLAIDTTQG